MKVLITTIFCFTFNYLFSQGPWIVGDERFETYTLAKDYKFDNIENYKEIIPINEFDSSQVDPFQNFITERYSNALGEKYRLEFIQTSFIGTTDEIDRVYIIVIDRSAFKPENFDQSLDYGALITDLRNIEESFIQGKLLDELNMIFPILKTEALEKRR